MAGHLAGRSGGLPAVPCGDLAGAMFAALAIASALFARGRTGHETSIDISMTDRLASWMTPFLGPALNGQRPLDFSAEPAYGSFHCRDGKVLSLSIAHEDHFWHALCLVLNLAALAELRARQRGSRVAELRERVAVAIAGDSLGSWATRLDAAGIPWSPVNDLAGAAADPHFRKRGLFSTLPGQGEGGTWFVHQPIKFGSYGSVLRRGVPALGENTSEVLDEATGKAERLRLGSRGYGNSRSDADSAASPRPTSPGAGRAIGE